MMNHFKIPWKLASAFLLLTIASSLNGQALIEYSGPGSQGAGALNFALAPNNAHITGDPFFSPDWQKGVIHYNGVSYIVNDLKYDVCMNELVFRHEGNIYLVPDKEKITRFEMGEDVFVRLPDKLPKGFLQVVEGGNVINLLRQRVCKVEQGSPSKGYIPSTPNKYIQTDVYFIQRPDAALIAINPRKGKEILSYLKSDRPAAERFITTQKLKMKKADDLTRLIRFLNTL